MELLKTSASNEEKMPSKILFHYWEPTEPNAEV